MYDSVEFYPPMLFIYLYTNQPTDKLVAWNADCYFSSMCINHVMYADDIQCMSISTDCKCNAIFIRYMLWIWYW